MVSGSINWLPAMATVGTIGFCRRQLAGNTILGVGACWDDAGDYVSERRLEPGSTGHDILAFALGVWRR